MKLKNAALSVAFLFDDSLDSSDGVAQYVKTLGAWFTRHGHKVNYLVGQTKMSRWEGGRIYSLSRNTKVRFNGNKLSTPLPGFNSRNIDRVIKQIKPDIVFVQVPYSPFMAQKVLKRLPSNTAVVASFNIVPANAYAKHSAKLLRFLLLPSLERVDKWLAVSAPAAKFAKSTLNVKADISPNVFPLSTYWSYHGQGSKRPKIVFLGRLVERKGAHYLLEAFSLLHKRLPNIDLVLAGAGPQKKALARRVRELGLEQSVSLPGFIPERNKTKLLSGADVACFPSTGGESFGISLLEAMSAARGVVLAGDNPGYRAILSSKHLIDSTDTKLFAEHLYKLLTDEKLAAQLHKWQREAVRQYDVEKVAPELLGTFRSVIAKRRG